MLAQSAAACLAELLGLAVARGGLKGDSMMSSRDGCHGLPDADASAGDE